MQSVTRIGYKRSTSFSARLRLPQFILFPTIGLITLLGCREETVSPAAIPPTVTVAVPVRRDVQSFNDFSGHTEAIESVEIRARVRGFLEEVRFVASSMVKAGDVLFVIEQKPYRIAIEKAQAELNRREAEYTRAKWEKHKIDQLTAQGSANEEEQIDVDTAIAITEAAVRAAEAAVDDARLNLAYTEVKSPISGRVSRPFVDVGNLVGAGENTLLTTVAKLDPIYVYFDASEKVFLDYTDRRREAINRGEPPDAIALLGLTNQTDFPFEGRINYVDNSVNPRTGTIRVRAVFRNEDYILFPGLFARVRVPFKVKEQAMLVPLEAIGIDLNSHYVIVVNDKDTAERRTVSLGTVYDGLRVVKSGLIENDRVIIRGLQRARPGMPVKPELVRAAATPQPTTAVKP